MMVMVIFMVMVMVIFYGNYKGGQWSVVSTWAVRSVGQWSVVSIYQSVVGQWSEVRETDRTALKFMVKITKTRARRLGAMH